MIATSKIVLKLEFLFRLIRESRLDNSQYEIYINQAELTLPSYELYTENATRDLLTKYISKVVKLLLKMEKSPIRNISQSEIEDIVNFEGALALKSQRPDLAKVSLLTLKEADIKASIGITWGIWVDFFNDLWQLIYQDHETVLEMYFLSFCPAKLSHFSFLQNMCNKHRSNI